MTTRLALVVLIGVAALAAFAFLSRGSSKEDAVVARVIDGDTIELVDGRRVRLVQIDTPEKHLECYGDEASALTERLLPAGTRVRIEQDPNLDHVDRYDRTLAYVWNGDEDVNVTLVRDGAAGVWFFDGRRGRYANDLLDAAERAQAAHKGLWGACPLARFDPNDSMSSGPAS
ncbi:MAG TPA: thermonuclease family protein [Gaiellaceae bacterium]|nr:thermonuclease family protein [Gaiellaceae bacterium]